MGNWRVCSVVVPSEALTITTGNKTSFEARENAVVIAFDFKDPLAGNRFRTTGKLSDRNEAIYRTVSKRFEFFGDGNGPLALVRRQ